MRVGIVLALMLAACHDLPDPGVCGNGVIEADQGEACDGSEGCTATCEITCAADRSCADGATCGLDNVCRAPSGMFYPLGESQVFDMKVARVGDFNGDAIDDLVGASGTEIFWRIGSATATPFAEGFGQGIAASQGNAAIFDRDPTTTTPDVSDLAVAIPSDGLALLVSDKTTFAPQIDGAIEVPVDSKVRIVVADVDLSLGDVVVEIDRNGGGGPLGVARSELRVGSDVLVPRRQLPACGNPGQPSMLVGVAVEPGRHRFVIVGRNPSSDATFVCTYTDFARALAPLAGAAPTSVVLADVDSDTCNELLLTHSIGTTTDVSMLDASGMDCTFAASTTSVGTTDSVDELLAAGAIDSSLPRDELVLSSGVYTVGGGLIRIAAPSLDPWTAAAVVDLDRDGRVDVVAARNREDIDIVRGGVAPHVRFTADTIRPAVAVVPGDFDGDGFGDCALVEGGNIDQLTVLYGAPGGVAGVRPNSVIGGQILIARLDRFTWGKTARGNDGIDDLLVLHTTADSTHVGVLLGEPSRLMTMPVFPDVQVASIGALAIGQVDDTQTAIAIRPTGELVGELMSLALSTTPGAAFETRPITGFDIDATRSPQFVNAPGGTVLAAFGVTADDPEARLITPAGAVCTGQVASAGSAHAIDVDGDGLDELAINLVNRRLRVFSVRGGAGCAIGDELFADAFAECADAVRAGNTIVTACVFNKHVELFTVVDGVRDATPFGQTDGAANRLFAGDFNGDGVPDVAMTAIRNGVVNVQLFAQCPAHDTRLCR